MILKHILKASKLNAVPQSLKTQPPATPEIPSVSAFDTSSARFRVTDYDFDEKEWFDIRMSPREN
jgi:hypothetical protein